MNNDQHHDTTSHDDFEISKTPSTTTTTTATIVTVSTTRTDGYTSTESDNSDDDDFDGTTSHSLHGNKVDTTSVLKQLQRLQNDTTTNDDVDDEENDYFVENTRSTYINDDDNIISNDTTRNNNEQVMLELEEILAADFDFRMDLAGSLGKTIVNNLHTDLSYHSTLRLLSRSLNHETISYHRQNFVRSICHLLHRRIGIDPDEDDALAISATQSLISATQRHLNLSSSKDEDITSLFREVTRDDDDEGCLLSIALLLSSLPLTDDLSRAGLTITGRRFFKTRGLAISSPPAAIRERRHVSLLAPLLSRIVSRGSTTNDWWEGEEGTTAAVGLACVLGRCGRASLLDEIVTNRTGGDWIAAGMRCCDPVPLLPASIVAELFSRLMRALPATATMMVAERWMGDVVNDETDVAALYILMERVGTELLSGDDGSYVATVARMEEVRGCIDDLVQTLVQTGDGEEGGGVGTGEEVRWRASKRLRAVEVWSEVWSTMYSSGVNIDATEERSERGRGRGDDPSIADATWPLPRHRGGSVASQSIGTASRRRVSENGDSDTEGEDMRTLNTGITTDEGVESDVMMRRVVRGERDIEISSVAPHAPSGSNGHRGFSRMKKMYAVSIVLMVMILVGLTIYAIITLRTTADVTPTDPDIITTEGITTKSSQDAARAAHITKIIRQISPSAVGGTTPHAKALQWIINTDVQRLTATSKTLIQRYVLVLLYYSLSGDGWLRSGRWLSGESECAWHGVGCDQEGFVWDLELGDNNMTGSLPYEIVTSVPHLLNLFLHDNNLSGSLPVLRDDMMINTELTSIALEYNRLTGSIPLPNWGLFLNITNLYLRSNDFSGTIPEITQQNNNLRHLDLSSNNLTGTIPSSIDKWVHLTSLHLHGNLLEGDVPNSLSHLVLLDELSLHRNKFNATSSIPCTNLTTSLSNITISSDCLNATPINVTDFNTTTTATPRTTTTNTSITTVPSPVNCSCCSVCCPPSLNNDDAQCSGLMKEDIPKRMRSGRDVVRRKRIRFKISRLRRG